MVLSSTVTLTPPFWKSEIHMIESPAFEPDRIEPLLRSFSPFYDNSEPP